MADRGDQYDEDGEIDDRAAAAADAAYEREYEDDHSWELLQEDEHGNLRALDDVEEQRARRRRLLSAAQSARIRRGMIRYVQLVVDLSRAAGLADMRPVRSAVMAAAVAHFVRTFFDENPLSQLGVIVLRNGVAERLTELSSSPEVHIQKLRRSLDTAGDASLQNGLDLAVSSLSSIPPYGHREVLVLLAALSTCDPGNIADSVRAAKAAKVRVSIVGLAAEVHVCRTVAQDTGGTYTVATGEAHLEQLLLAHATPPPAAPGASGVSLVRMGFPPKGSEAPGTAAFAGADCALVPGAFACPRCAARTAELPAECHVCGLTLVSSPHLARSYHHLFPVQPFAEVAPAQLAEAQGSGGAGGADDLVVPELEGRVHCYGCLVPLQAATKQPARGSAPAAAEAAAAAVVLQCPGCRRLFCFDCDSFIHESLHNCPGCECLGGKDANGVAEMEAL